MRTGIHRRVIAEEFCCCEHVIDFVIKERKRARLSVLSSQHRHHHDEACFPIRDGHVPVSGAELEATVQEENGGELPARLLVAAHPRLQAVRSRSKLDFFDVSRRPERDDITLRRRTFAKQSCRKVPARLGIVFVLDLDFRLE